MIKKTFRTHYYELDWSVDYGETREKVYLAIRGTIEKYSCLDLTVRDVSYCWHETSNASIKEINKKFFLKNATSENIARFYSILPEYNAILNYPPKLMDSFKKHEPYFEDRIKKYKDENKLSVRLNLINLKKCKNNKSIVTKKEEQERIVR